MRYLCVIEQFFPDGPTGSARVAWDISMQMRDRGRDVSILCKRRASSDYPEGTSHRHGVRVIQYDEQPVPRWHPGRLRQITLSAFNAATRWLGAERWDLVHIHSPAIGRGVLDAIGRGPRYIYSAHSPIVLEQQVNWRQEKWAGKFKLLTALPLLRRLERSLLRDCERVHALSNFTRERLIELHGMETRSPLFLIGAPRNTRTWLART